MRNFELKAKSAVIENVRGKEDFVSLGTTGFQFYKLTSNVTMMKKYAVYQSGGDI